MQQNVITAPDLSARLWTWLDFDYKINLILKTQDNRRVKPLFLIYI